MDWFTWDAEASSHTCKTGTSVLGLGPSQSQTGHCLAGNYLGSPQIDPLTKTVHVWNPHWTTVTLETRLSRLLRHKLGGIDGCRDVYNEEVPAGAADLIFTGFEKCRKSVASGRLTAALRCMMDSERSGKAMEGHGFTNACKLAYAMGCGDGSRPMTGFTILQTLMLRVSVAYLFVGYKTPVGESGSARGLPERGKLGLYLQLWIDQMLDLADYMMHHLYLVLQRVIGRTRLVSMWTSGELADRLSPISDKFMRESGTYTVLYPHSRRFFSATELCDTTHLMPYSSIWREVVTTHKDPVSRLVHIIAGKTQHHKCLIRNNVSITIKYFKSVPYMKQFCRDLIAITMLGNYPTATYRPRFQARVALRRHILSLDRAPDNVLTRWMLRNRWLVYFAFKEYFAYMLRFSHSVREIMIATQEHLKYEVGVSSCLDAVRKIIDRGFLSAVRQRDTVGPRFTPLIMRPKPPGSVTVAPASKQEPKGVEQHDVPNQFGKLYSYEGYGFTYMDHGVVNLSSVLRLVDTEIRMTHGYLLRFLTKLVKVPFTRTLTTEMRNWPNNQVLRDSMACARKAAISVKIHTLVEEEGGIFRVKITEAMRRDYILSRVLEDIPDTVQYLWIAKHASLHGYCLTSRGNKHVLSFMKMARALQQGSHRLEQVGPQQDFALPPEPITDPIADETFYKSDEEEIEEIETACEKLDDQLASTVQSYRKHLIDYIVSLWYDDNQQEQDTLDALLEERSQDLELPQLIERVARHIVEQPIQGSGNGLRTNTNRVVDPKWLFALGVTVRGVIWYMKTFRDYEILQMPDNAFKKRLQQLYSWSPSDYEIILQLLTAVLRVRVLPIIELPHPRIAVAQVGALRRRLEMETFEQTPDDIGVAFYCDCGKWGETVVDNSSEAGMLHAAGSMTAVGFDHVAYDICEQRLRCQDSKHACQHTPLHRVDMIGRIAYLGGNWIVRCVICARLTPYSFRDFTELGPTCGQHLADTQIGRLRPAKPIRLPEHCPMVNRLRAARVAVLPDAPYRMPLTCIYCIKGMKEDPRSVPPTQTAPYYATMNPFAPARGSVVTYFADTGPAKEVVCGYLCERHHSACRAWLTHNPLPTESVLFNIISRNTTAKGFARATRMSKSAVKRYGLGLASYSGSPRKRKASKAYSTKL